MKTPKVLIVDDDPAIRNLLVQFVGESGYQAEGAPDGEAAIELVERDSFDAVLTDLKMPRLGGIDLVRRLKGVDPNLPVIVITAYPTVESGVSALKLGASDFISKPFRTGEIKILLDRLLMERRLLTGEPDRGGRCIIDSINSALYEKVRYVTLPFSHTPGAQP